MLAAVIQTAPNAGTKMIEPVTLGDLAHDGKRERAIEPLRMPRETPCRWPQ